MSDSPDPAPSAEVVQSPASALKALAAALETGSDVPDQARIVEILASFKAGGLDRPTQEMVIEAREAAKEGRRPDPLALRMIAKALSAPRKVKAPPQTTGEPRGLRPISAAPVVDIDAGLGKLREQANGAVAALTDREREVLDERFGVPQKPSNGVRATVPEFNEGMNRAAGVMHAPPIAQFDVLAAMKASSESLAEVWDEPAPSRTAAEWVAAAADVIEHLDMPAHAELCGELYALAQKLEESPLPDPTAAPLLERVEREIERRVERAIASKADLPEWVIDWARAERARAGVLVQAGEHFVRVVTKND